MGLAARSYTRAMIRFTLALFACLALTACPKNVTTTVAGSDDAQMDQYSSILEEYRTKTDLSCADTCAAKKKVCAVSGSACEMSSKATDRTDFQQKCVTSQEDCAKFNEACANCSGK